MNKTSFFSEIPNLDFNQRCRRSDLSALAYNAYVGLSKLCNRLHGPIDKNTKLVRDFLAAGCSFSEPPEQKKDQFLWCSSVGSGETGSMYVQS